MLKPQKKFNKKELKHDPLLDTLLKAQTYYEQNTNIIYGALAGIVAIVLIVLLVNYIQDVNAEEATALLGKAQVEYDQMNYDKARDFLDRLIDEYSGTDAGEQGLFLLANLNYQDEQYAQAKTLFEEFTDSYSGSNILLASGYAGLAACYEQEKDFKTAADYYDRAQSRAGEFTKAGDYLYLQALCLLNAGEQEDAREVLDELVERFPEHRHSYDAKSQLVLLNKSR